MTGIQGDKDAAPDAWLTTPETGTPELSWSPSTDAVFYGWVIRDSLGNVICEAVDIPAPETKSQLSLCPVLENGKTYTLVVTSQDEAGNTTSTSPFDFTVDRIPPGPFSIQGLSTLTDVFIDNFLGKGLPQVHFTSSENSSHYEIGIFDGLGVVPYCPLVQFNGPATSFTFGALPENSCLPLQDNTEYLVKIKAMDPGLNFTNATNDEFRFKTDFSGPQAHFTVTAPLLSNNRDVNFTFEYSDNVSGIDKVECVVDGTPESACLSPHSLNNLTEGTHSFLVNIKDLAGNITSLAHEWVTDLSKPVSQWLSKPPAFDNKLVPEIRFSAIDTGGGAVQEFECSIDDGDAEVCASPLALNLASGAHTLKVRALDTAGNWGDWISWSWWIDVTAPIIDSLLGPSDPNYSATNPVFTFAYHDEGGAGVYKVECSLDGGGFTVCSSPLSASLSAGSRVMVLRVTDRSGNVTTRSHSWYQYTYSWKTSGWGGCSAAPYWGAYGSWSSCTWVSGCTGTQSRSRSCYNTSGVQTRTVYCQRSDGVSVADSFCLAAKPTSSTSCSSSCLGSSYESQSCDACGVTGSASCTEYETPDCPLGCGGSGICPSTWSFSGTAQSGGCASGHTKKIISTSANPINAGMPTYFQCIGPIH